MPLNPWQEPFESIKSPGKTIFCRGFVIQTRLKPGFTTHMPVASGTLLETAFTNVDVAVTLPNIPSALRKALSALPEMAIALADTASVLAETSFAKAETISAALVTVAVPPKVRTIFGKIDGVLWH